MNFFECCHKCPSTKRHPGCHSKCEDYIEQSALWEAHKEKQRKKSAEFIPPAKTDYLNSPIWWTKKY